MSKFKPITSIEILNSKTQNVRRIVGASINEKGDLVFSGDDFGELPEQMLGGDYEYSATVSAENKDSLLLLLLKERFGDFPEFEQWLKEKGIPFDLWRYS